MTKDEIEQVYWFTVSDVADLLAHANVPLETMLGDVFDNVLKTNPTSGVLMQLLAVIDQLEAERIKNDANEAQSQIFEA